MSGRLHITLQTSDTFRPALHLPRSNAWPASPRAARTEAKDDEKPQMRPSL